jgi:hypothetical protein
VRSIRLRTALSKNFKTNSLIWVGFFYLNLVAKIPRFVLYRFALV